MTTPTATVSDRGRRRLEDGHPWIYRSDLLKVDDPSALVVTVVDARGRVYGTAFHAPNSEIRLRLVSRERVTIDRAWLTAKIKAALAWRARLKIDGTACRLIHAEADGLPALVVDQYGDVLVTQFQSAPIDSFRDLITEILVAETGAKGILMRADGAGRRLEGLSSETVPLFGSVPEIVEAREGTVRYLVAPWTGQKTGAFLDQRENRLHLGWLTKGRALDCFSYHGSFALHMATKATEVIALDSSADALARARENADLNGFKQVKTVEVNAFDWLRAADDAGEQFDTIALDPPAFAKSRASLPKAVTAYKEVNLRAMKILAPGGTLFTASCSFHMSREQFRVTVMEAAQDAGRTFQVVAETGQSADHPELLTVPETAYLKGLLLVDRS